MRFASFHRHRQLMIISAAGYPLFVYRLNSITQFYEFQPLSLFRQEGKQYPRPSFLNVDSKSGTELSAPKIAVLPALFVQVVDRL